MRAMFKPLSLYVGLRYSGAKRRNHFISFISLVSVAGLALGVAVLITVLSVMNGFDRELQQRILGMIPHGSLVGYQPIEDWQPLVAEIEEYPHVVGASPFIELEAMLTQQGEVAGALVSGISPDYEKQVSIIEKHMELGSLDALTPGSFGMVLGSSMAYRLGVFPGDKVTLVLPEASISPAGVIPRFKRFTVVGVFKVGAELDSTLAFINIEDAGRLIRQPGTAQGIRVQYDDLFAAPQLTRQLADSLQQPLQPRNWTYTHGNLFQAIQMEKAMMALLLFFIVAVAIFNIVSSLVMVVTDKQSDIAILRSLGATPSLVMRIFMVQGTLIGLGGVLIGTLLGVLLASNITSLVNNIEQFFNLSLFDAYFVNFLPSQLVWSDVLMVSSIAFGMSFIATLYPAWRASKVEPAEVLRYE